MTTDKELIVDVAKALAKAYYHKHGLETLFPLNAEQYASDEWEQWENEAQAVVAHIREHTAPLIDALEFYGDAIRHARVHDDRSGVYPCARSDVDFDKGSRAIKALASLPPILKGGE